MIDFNSLAGKTKELDISTIQALFNSLDVETSHTELRTTQKEALSQLTERIESKDLVLKISTGAGKTAIGLLFLQFHMIKYKEPVVYLCPTIQLVNQVLNETRKLGLTAFSYPQGEPHPHYKCLSGEAILVCTYDKLFNARSTFNRTDVQLRPYAIVLDDAHSGIEKIKKSFTFTITEKEKQLHNFLMRIFESPCKNINPFLWQLIKNNDPLAFIELPFWEWKSLISDVENEIPKYKDSLLQVRFVWPHLTNNLEYCRCIVSGNGIEITPSIIPTQNCSAFEEAKHRLFMSATLADDSELIRQLGCDVTSAMTSIQPPSDRGLGERMVLAPSLIHSSLNKEWVIQQCIEWVKKYNIVVICPNEQATKAWEQSGAIICLGDDVEPKVTELKDNTSPPQLVVFTQRYDGIDLPDRAARILIIDGLPKGESLSDKYDASISVLGALPQNHLIYRIEQGMGRAVRSHADYAVILLTGHDIAHFVVKKEVLNQMTPDTREQIKLGIQLVEHAISSEIETPEEIKNRSNAVNDMITKCLGRDSGWKTYYDKKIRKNEQKNNIIDQLSIEIANAERTAFALAKGNNTLAAYNSIISVIDKHKLNDNLKGFLLHKAARYLNCTDPAKALEIQAHAYKLNPKVGAAPNIICRPINFKNNQTHINISTWFNTFDNPNGPIAFISELKSKLNLELHFKIIEASFKELAEPLGAEGYCPEREFGRGPDIMWSWGDFDYIIEIKNENKQSLHKKDAGQLNVSMNWHKKSYKERLNRIPIIVAKVSKIDSNAYFEEGTRLITQTEIDMLFISLEGFYRELAQKLPLEKHSGIVRDLQTKYGLTPEAFKIKFTKIIK